MPCNSLCWGIPLPPQGTLLKPMTPQAWGSKVKRASQERTEKGKGRTNHNFFLVPKSDSEVHVILDKRLFPLLLWAPCATAEATGFKAWGQAAAGIAARNQYVLQECFSARGGLGTLSQHCQAEELWKEQRINAADFKCSLVIQWCIGGVTLQDTEKRQWSSPPQKASTLR